MLTPLAVGAVAVQRLAELAYARGNERAARAHGAFEVGAGHYPAIVALHAGWLAGILWEGRATRRPRPLPAVAFVAAQCLRLWTIRTLGPQWTTRIIVDPTAEPVTHGPYRLVRHPNYVAVAIEIAALPLALGAPRTAAVASVADALVLRHRIRIEDQARRSAGSHGPRASS